MYYLSLVKLNRLRFKYGMKVRLNSCGKGLCIVHLGSIITNGDVGEDARLFVNSAIVSNGGGEREPRLGNHVTLFTNAVVCGDVKIGNMSVIGPRPGLWNQDLLTAERDKYNANDIKPGLTGWAQINGRDELMLHQKIAWHPMVNHLMLCSVINYLLL